MGPAFAGGRLGGGGEADASLSMASMVAWMASQRGLQNSDIWRRMLTGLPHNLQERFMLSGEFPGGDMAFQANTGLC